MLFYLLLYDLLQERVGHDPRDNTLERTDAWTPDFFSISISSAVKGCTNSPSLINSLVASVSSVEYSQTNSKMLL